MGLGVYNRSAVVRILYTNHRGETDWRRIIPGSIRFAATEWHPDRQWLLDAWDLDRNAERTFALRNIHAWQPDGGQGGP